MICCIMNHPNTFDMLNSGAVCISNSKFLKNRFALRPNSFKAILDQKEIKLHSIRWYQLAIYYPTYQVVKLRSSQSSGVATGVARGARVPPLTAKKCQKSGKEVKNQENWGKGKKNQEETWQKLGRFFHFAPPDR